MIEIKQLAKAFAVGKQKKLSDSEKNDVRFGGDLFHSVRNVSFQCERGQVLGLLGPNGAGKTTTLRMLSTALKPDAGSILIDGHDVIHNPLEVRKRIGFLSADTGLYGRLTAKENIEYFARSVPCEEIATKEYNLSVSSYVEAKDNREVTDITQLNAEIESTVGKITKLRAEIDLIVTQIEGDKNE